LPLREIAGRDQIDAAGLLAEHTEEVHLSDVVAAGNLRMRMVQVAAAGREGDSAIDQSSGLALHSPEGFAVLNDQVAAGVLAERGVDAIAVRAKSEHDGERRAVADVLRVLHLERVPMSSDKRVQNRQQRQRYD